MGHIKKKGCKKSACFTATEQSSIESQGWQGVYAKCLCARKKIWKMAKITWVHDCMMEVESWIPLSQQG